MECCQKIEKIIFKKIEKYKQKTQNQLFQILEKNNERNKVIKKLNSKIDENYSKIFNSLFKDSIEKNNFELIKTCLKDEMIKYGSTGSQDLYDIIKYYKMKKSDLIKLKKTLYKFQFIIKSEQNLEFLQQNVFEGKKSKVVYSLHISKSFRIKKLRKIIQRYDNFIVLCHSQFQNESIYFGAKIIYKDKEHNVIDKSNSILFFLNEEQYIFGKNTGTFCRNI